MVLASLLLLKCYFRFRTGIWLTALKYQDFTQENKRIQNIYQKYTFKNCCRDKMRVCELPTVTKKAWEDWFWTILIGDSLFCFNRPSFQWEEWGLFQCTEWWCVSPWLFRQTTCISRQGWYWQPRKPNLAQKDFKERKPKFCGENVISF